MARVLRGKYFKAGSFLSAKAKGNDSIVWKSIVWGRSLFREGFKLKV